jgi:hypothetical protein
MASRFGFKTLWQRHTSCARAGWMMSMPAD